MKKAFCTLLLILPIYTFFTQDFGAAKIWLVLFGVVLCLIIISDFVFKKNLIIPTCKILYCFAYVPAVLIHVYIQGKRERKAKQRDRKM